MCKELKISVFFVIYADRLIKNDGYFKTGYDKEDITRVSSTYFDQIINEMDTTGDKKSALLLFYNMVNQSTDFDFVILFL